MMIFSSKLDVCHFNIKFTGAGVMHGAGYLEHLVPLPIFWILYICLIHYLVSPLRCCTLIFDLIRNLLYTYNVYITL